MTILSGKEINRLVKEGAIKIEPYAERQLNPASYDLRMAPELMINAVDLDRHHRRWTIKRFCRWLRNDHLSVDREADMVSLHVPPDGIVLQPGITYLGGTLEVIKAENYIGIFDGKSSLGRVGVFTHVTAGYVDNGFHGQITTEIVVVRPIRLFPAMRIGQIRFHPIQGEVVSYQDTGNYIGWQPAPVPSKVHLQIKKDRELHILG